MKTGIVALVAAAAAYVIPHDASRNISPNLALERRAPKTSHTLAGSHGKCLAAIADAEDASRQTGPHETREKRSPEDPMHVEMNPILRYHISETPEKKHARLEGQLVNVAKHLLDSPLESDDPADYMHPELKEKWIKYIKDDAEKKNPPKTPEVEPLTEPSPLKDTLTAEPEQPQNPADASPSESSPDEQSKELEPTGEEGGSDEVEPQEPDIQLEQQKTLEEAPGEIQEPQEPEVQSEEEQVIDTDETSDKVDRQEPEKPSDEQVQPAEASASEEVKLYEKEEVPKEVKEVQKAAKPSKGPQGLEHGGKTGWDMNIAKLFSGAAESIRKGMSEGHKAGSAISGMGVPAAAVIGAASVGPEGLAAATGPGTAAVGAEELARAQVPGTESLAEALNLGGVGNPADAVIDAESLGSAEYLAPSEALSGPDVSGKGPGDLPSTGHDLATPDAEALGAESGPAAKGHSAIGTGSKILGAAVVAGGVASKIAEGVATLGNALPVPPVAAANGTKKEDELEADMEPGPSTLYEGGQEEDQDEEDREPDDRDDFDVDLEEADQKKGSQDEGSAEVVITEDMDKVVDFFGRATRMLFDILRKLRALQVEIKAARKTDKENEEKQKAIEEAQEQKAIDDAQEQEDQETPRKNKDKHMTQKQKVKKQAEKKKDKMNAQKKKDKEDAQKEKDKKHAQKQKHKEDAPKEKDRKHAQNHKDKETHREQENIPKQRGLENPESQKNKMSPQRLAELRQGAGELLKASPFGQEFERMGFGCTGNQVVGGMAEQVLDVTSGQSEMSGKQGSPYMVNGVQIDPDWKEKHPELFAPGQACAGFEHLSLLELVEADNLYKSEQAGWGQPVGHR